MANIVKTYSFVNSQPADATQVNKNFDDIIAGVGDISAAGHALIDDADAAAQIATLGLDADIATLALPANTTITVAAQTILDDTTVAAMLATLGGVSRNIGSVTDFNTALTDGEYFVGVGSSVPNAPYTGGFYGKLRVLVSDGGTHNNVSNWIWQYTDDTEGRVYYRYKANSAAWNAWQQITTNAVPITDARLSDARTPVAHTHVKANITDFPASLPASDVSAWAKAASNVAIPGAFGCNGKTAQTAGYCGPVLGGHGSGTYGLSSQGAIDALFEMVRAIQDQLIKNGIIS